MNNEKLCLMCREYYIKTLRNGYRQERCRRFGTAEERSECVNPFHIKLQDKPKYPGKKSEPKKKVASGHRPGRQDGELCDTCGNFKEACCVVTGETNPKPHPDICNKHYWYDFERQKKNTQA